MRIADYRQVCRSIGKSEVDAGKTTENSPLNTDIMAAVSLQDIHLDRPELPEVAFGAVEQLAMLGEGAEPVFTDVENVFTGGDLILDEQSRLTKKYYVDSNRSRSDLFDYEAYMALLLRQISSRKIPFNRHTYLTFRNVFFRTPYHKTMVDNKEVEVILTPNDARRAQITYDTEITSEVIELWDGEDGIHKKGELRRILQRNNETRTIVLGHIPIMLGSSLCILHGLGDREILNLGESVTDPFGYFVIEGGGEWAAMKTDQIRLNHFFCNYSKKGDVFEPYCSITCDDLHGTKLFKISLTRQMPKGEKNIPKIENPVMLASMTLKTFEKEDPIRINFLALCKWLQPERSNEDIFEEFFSLFPVEHLLKAQSVVNRTIGGFLAMNYEDQIIAAISKVKSIQIAERSSHEVRNAEHLRSLMVKRQQDASNKSTQAWKLFLTAADARRLYREEMISNLFPQIPDEYVGRKVTSILMTAYKLVMFTVGAIQEDSKDNWAHKRVKTPGELIFRRFMKFFDKVVDGFRNKEVRTDIHDVNIQVADSLDNATSSLNSAFKSNKWGMRSTSTGKDNQKFSQMLERKSALDTISQLDRIISNSGKKSRNFEMRQVQSSQAFYIGPAETQEGEKCGQNKPRARVTWFTIPRFTDLYLDSILTSGHIQPTQSVVHTLPIEIDGHAAGYCNPSRIKPLFKKAGFASFSIEPDRVVVGGERTKTDFFADLQAVLTKRTNQASTPFFYNGGFVGWCAGKVLKERLRTLKRRGSIPRTSCIVLDSRLNALFLQTDQGRPTRPCLLVNQKTGKLIIDEKRLWDRSWKELLLSGAVEYMDAWEQEQEDVLLAVDIKDIRNARLELDALQNKIDLLTRQREENGEKLHMIVSMGTEEYLTESEMEERRKKVIVELDSRINVLQKKHSRLELIKREQERGLAAIKPENIDEKEIAGHVSGQLASFSKAVDDAKARVLQLENTIKDTETAINSAKDRNDSGGIASAITKMINTQEELMEAKLELEAAERQAVDKPSYAALVEVWNNQLSDKLRKSEMEFARRLELTNKAIKTIETQMQDLQNKKTLHEVVVANPTEEIARLKYQKARFARENAYSHCTLDPNDLLSTVTAILPLPNHNQAPRNTYGGKMMRQAVGTYHTAHSMRYDTTARVLAMPQAPLTITQQYKLEGLTEAPTTQTLMLAMMTWGGGNQEDGLILKKEWAERAGITIKYHSHSDSVQDASAGGTGEYFGELPSSLQKGQTGVYSLIDRETGAAKQGMRVRMGRKYCIIAKYSYIEVKGIMTYVDNSTYVKNIDGLIDSVEIIREGGKTIIHVKISELRYPIVGNKFASRSAQKSIIAILMPAALMPALVDPRSGKIVIPDIIMNPLAMPTRMTISQPLEMLGGIFATITGQTVDVSAFKSFNAGDFKRWMKEMGYKNPGMYHMEYNPITGDAMQKEVFMAPVSYQVLRHMVLDKEQMRGIMGPRTINKQPVHNKDAGGGTKFGIMEIDAMMAYGMYEPLIHKAIRASDSTDYFYCTTCKGEIHYKKANQRFMCNRCEMEGKEYNPMRVRIPFATMVFRQQLAVMGIAINPKIAPSKEEMAFARLGERAEFVEDKNGKVLPERDPAISEELALANPPPKHGKPIIRRRKRED